MGHCKTYSIFKNKKIIFFVTEDWVFCSHRLPLAVAARKKGFDVIVITRADKFAQTIRHAGIRLIPLEEMRRSANPFREILRIMQLVRLFRKERPDIIHNVALKPVVLGSIAAFVASVPCVVNALTGMGYVYTSSSQKARLLRGGLGLLFRHLFNRPFNRLIVQNSDDRELMLKSSVNPNQISLIRGSGVDLQEFAPSIESNDVPVVLLASRMLWHKGVREFVAAAKLLLERGVRARFVLVGDSDPANPSAVPTSILCHWQSSGTVEWWGKSNDMAGIFAKSHIVCLPSYREGLPKVLLEAAAAGKPIVAADVPGCREIVRNAENGFLVPKGQVAPLAGALKLLIEDPALRQRMGAQSRKMSKDFSLDKVIDQTLFVYKSLLTAKYRV